VVYTSVVTDLANLRSTLAARALPDGGWGYAPGRSAHPEPTCLALLALRGEESRFKDAIAAGIAALQRHALPDGSYRFAAGRSEAAWPTALALFTRAALGETNLDQTAQRLKTMRGRVMKADPEVADMMDIDVRLVGWPWAEGNFPWVEPTAWAVLALRRARAGDCREVAEGLRLLLDRAFDEGGVNYGNRLVLGRMTEPIPTPTALMLLATQGLRDEPRIAAALRYLRGEAEHTNDLEHLGWSRLAFASWKDHPEVGDAPERVDERILRVLAEHADSPLTVRHALAILALDCERYHPFILSGAPTLGEATGSGGAAPERSLLKKVVSGVRGLLVGGMGSLRPPPAASAVHIASAESYDPDLAAVLRAQFEHFRTHVPLAGKRVVLKPNLVEYHRGKVINTDPRVVAAVIELCKSEGAAEIIVAEGPGHWRNVQYLVDESGLGEVLKKYNVPFIDLNHDEPEKLLNLGRLTGLDYLYIARTVVQTDVLISLPKLKTHHWAGATLSLKNLFGTLPGICYGWPKNELHWRGIPQSIVDIALTNTPHLAIVDGIVGMEGDGPLNGSAKPMGLLVMGADLLAVDATCCRLMGLDPRRIPYLMLGQQKKLGRLNEADIPQLGETIATKMKRFQLPPKVDKHLLAQPA
jgi:uncharacterized protein (DUF362 family)